MKTSAHSLGVAFSLAALPAGAAPTSSDAHSIAAAVTAAVRSAIRTQAAGPADLGLRSTAGDVLAYTAYYQDHGYTIDRLVQSYHPGGRLLRLDLLASRRSPTEQDQVLVRVDAARKEVQTSKKVSVSVSNVSVRVSVHGE